ncbi:MAG: hypothetical protein ACREFQ_13410 [Stellaceae bacterium]
MAAVKFAVGANPEARLLLQGHRIGDVCAFKATERGGADLARANLERASCSAGGRSRLPTMSALKGGLAMVFSFDLATVGTRD